MGMKARIRTRQTPSPPDKWPNGAEICTKGGDVLLGWGIRLKMNQHRFWANNRGSPVYLGDFEQFCDGLVPLVSFVEKLK